MDRKAMGLPTAPWYFEPLWAWRIAGPVAARSNNGTPVGNGGCGLAAGWEMR
jgi:hypothetical protein